MFKWRSHKSLAEILVDGRKGSLDWAKKWLRDHMINNPRKDSYTFNVLLDDEEANDLLNWMHDEGLTARHEIIEHSLTSQKISKISYSPK